MSVVVAATVFAVVRPVFTRGKDVGVGLEVDTGFDEELPMVIEDEPLDRGQFEQVTIVGVADNQTIVMGCFVQPVEVCESSR